jgi:hypothetical protein
MFDLATGRMLSALRGYYIWKWFNQATNIGMHGKEIAQRNAGILNKHKFVFKQIIDSTFKSYVTDLAIFFDAERQVENLSQGKLLRTLKDKLTVDELQDLNKKIEDIKRSHGVKIRFLRDLRGEDVSHQTIYPQEKVINYVEIEELFKAVQEILNLISNHFNGSETLWGHIQEEVIHHLEWMFEDLERGEAQRVGEIEKEYLLNRNK